MSKRTGRLFRVGGAMTLVLFAVVLLTQTRAIRNELVRRAHPYVVLVSIDTLQINRTGPYNPEVRGTPALDAFAREGVLFRYAYTPAPITLPAHTSLLTGVSPLGHGVMANGDVVPSSLTTLAEILREAGYQTAAFVSLGVLARAFRLDQGFDFYEDSFHQKGGRTYIRAHEVFGPVEKWLSRSHGEPFFIWVHFSDPHDPYVPVGASPDTRVTFDGRLVGEWNLVSKEPVSLSLVLPPGRHRLSWTSLRGAQPDDRPETCVRLYVHNREGLGPFVPSPLPETDVGVDLRPSWDLALENPMSHEVEIRLQFTGELVRPAPSDVLDAYRREVEYTDHYLGKLRRLFEILGIDGDTLWVIVSDHGEGLFNHDVLGHAEFVFEDQLRILWLMRGPGVPRGTVVEKPPGLMVDVAPTLLASMGLAVPAEMEGRSLVECWESPSGARPCTTREEGWWAYGVRHATNSLTAMAGYHWPYKWIWRRGRGRVAYHVLDDPWEARDLLQKPGPERAGELKALAERFRNERQAYNRRLKDPRRLAQQDAQHRELLRSLGYLGGSSQPVPEEPR
ncbi:MAG: sulfatase [Acidobacteriota bacterium]